MYCCWGRSGLGDWCGIGGWINLLKKTQGGVPCDCKGKGFCALISNLVAVKTKTWGGRVRRRLNNVLIHLHNYTAGRYRDGGIVLLLGEKWVRGLVWNRGVD